MVYHAAGLDDEICKAIVRETSPVECTFLEPSDIADIRVRYFLASREIPFAGHPTLATAASMADRGPVRDGHVTLETGAGVIPVELTDVGGDGPVITMRQMRPILRRARLDAGALEALRRDARFEDADVMEPFPVTLRGISEQAATFSRLLLAPPMPPGDSFTGSATGAMAAYLWAEGLLERPEFLAEQGHWLGRPGQARVEVLGPRDDIEGVKVGGRGYVLMRGYLNI